MKGSLASQSRQNAIPSFETVSRLLLRFLEVFCDLVRAFKVVALFHSPTHSLTPR